MALETVVFQQDPFPVAWAYDFDFQQQGKFLSLLDPPPPPAEGHNICAESFLQLQAENFLADNNNNFLSPCTSITPEQLMMQQTVKEWAWDPPSSDIPPETRTMGAGSSGFAAPSSMEAPTGRRKRRRTRICKNKEEVESQRMTHIAVERNRRKQMNEYLAVLRSLMPPSYVQRGDQASIIGGAINYVKELEQSLQAHEAQKEKQPQRQEQQSNNNNNEHYDSLPFADFFTFPQYSAHAPSGALAATASERVVAEEEPLVAAAAADVEVTMVENHASIRIRSKRSAGQLWKIVAGFANLRLTTLHLNVATVDQTVLYSLSVKAEDGCQLNTVDDIAAAANQMLKTIHEENLPS